VPVADAAARARHAAELARYYDLDLAEDPGDVDMYLALADAADGQVLELAAGSGRICVPLAAAGHEVVGVDNDPAMLERAAARWAAVTDRKPGGSLDLVGADITKLDLGRRFGLVVLGLNSILLLDGRAEQRAALAAMAGHLAPGGRAVIDTWLPSPDDLAVYDGRLVNEWVRRDDESGEWVVKITSARYETAEHAAWVTSFFDAWADGGALRRTSRQDRISFLGASELEALSSNAGLEIERIAGNYEMGHFAPGSDRLVLLCRAVTD
jgi:SAM-dependent methyltransferase